jgi:hypothetical protein
MVTEMLDDSTESSAATAELIRHAATGQDHFTPATMHVLEQTSFNLALTCMRSDQDMTAFCHVSAIICRYRNTAVRERIAAVQEQKNIIREKEFQFKAGRCAASVNASALSVVESSEISGAQPESSVYPRAA